MFKSYKLFFLPLLLLCIISVLYFKNKYTYPRHLPWKTESVLSVIEDNTHYDITIMGSSHGRLFSRNKNHEIVEEKLNRKVATLASASSCVVPAKVFLNTFYDNGNSTKLILYFIDPWCLFNDKFNIRYQYENEPFDQELLENLRKFKVSEQIIDGYYNRTYNQGHEPLVYKEVNYKTDVIEKVDSSLVEKRLNELYENNIGKEISNDYVNSVEEIIDIAHTHDTKIIFIIPPTLYKDPHHKDLVDVLTSFQIDYKTVFVDMSESIPDSQYYYDLDHLNKNGVELFLELLIKELNRLGVEY